MRILGGQAKGRRLKSVPGATTRPPLARVRQALFNILQPVTPEAVWLDLFAGTGSYGIEAASRGAREVVMVEIDPKVAAVARENVAASGFGERITVIRNDVLREVPNLGRQARRFDVVGVAPPYFRGLAPRVLTLLDEAGVVAREGYVYVQRHRDEELPARTETLVLVRDYRYGLTVLTFYRPA